MLFNLTLKKKEKMPGHIKLILKNLHFILIECLVYVRMPYYTEIDQAYVNKPIIHLEYLKFRKVSSCCYFHYNNVKNLVTIFSSVLKSEFEGIDFHFSLWKRYST